MAMIPTVYSKKLTVTKALLPLFALLAAACTTAGTVPTGAPASADGEQPQQCFVVFTDIPMPADCPSYKLRPAQKSRPFRVI